jgi:diguanylate cyclase (GGDEF)-like protein
VLTTVSRLMSDLALASTIDRPADHQEVSEMEEAKQIPPAPPPPSAVDIQARLRKLERRDWSLWAVAVFILLLLCFVMFSLSFPAVLTREEFLFQQRLEIGVQGLLGVVLLFSIFALYQQFLIKQLRRRLAQQLVVSAAFQTRSEVLEQLAIQDDLTGLFNRRYAMDQLRVEVARSDRHGYPLSVLVLDLDDFKEVNDAYGHPAGDLVLQEFSRRLRRAIRNSDVPVRMGGDEFMVLLPECDQAQIRQPLERMRGCNVELDGRVIPIKFSSGSAQRKQGESPDALLKRADAVLYDKKRVRPTGTHAKLTRHGQLR